MYGLAAIAAGNIISGYGDAQSASATGRTLGDAYATQQGYNAQEDADVRRTLPLMGAPALRGDIDKASAPLYASQKQTQMLGQYLGKDLGPNSGGVEGARADTLRNGQRSVSAFGLRRAQEMQGRTLGELMSRRNRLAAKAEGQANLLPYQLRAAAMKGSAASDTGQLVSTAGSLWASSGKGSAKDTGSTPPPNGPDINGVIDNGDGTFTQYGRTWSK